MSNLVRRAAFNKPFKVKVVSGEILLQSDQAPVEIVLTSAAAKIVATRLFEAAEKIDLASDNDPAPLKSKPD